MSADKMKEQIEDLQDEAQETAQTFKERAMEWKQTATDGVVSFAKTTDTYVHENPWRAVGIAAGVGLLLGLLIGRR